MSYKGRVLETEGLKAFYDLDELSGVAEDSKNGHSGTPSAEGLTRAQPSLLPNGEGLSCKFDGVKGNFEIANHADLEIADTISVDFWASVASTASEKVVLALGANSADAFFSANPAKLAIGKTGIGYARAAKVGLSNELPHHFAITKEAGVPKLYIDSVEVEGELGPQTLEKSSAAKFIGKYSGGLFFKGTLQYLAIYNTALSASTIALHYAEGLPVSPPEAVIPPPPVWTFVVTKLDGTPLGELQNASGRSLSMPLNGPATAACTIRPDNAMIHKMYQNDTLLQVWEDHELRFWGPILSVQMSGPVDGLTVSVNAADPAWRLSRRLAGKSAEGKKFTTTDKAEMGKTLIEEANTANDTGIRFAHTTCGTTATYTAGPYKPVIQCINDVASSLAGFDWRIVPVHGEASPIIGKYDAYSVYGSEKKNIIFEAGTGKHNIKNFGFLRDLNGIVNAAYHLSTETFGTNVKAEDATSIAYRGRYEELTDPNSLESTALREEWVKSVVEVRKNPRNVVSMELSNQNDPAVPKLFKDFWLGDRVVARAKMADGIVLFNGLVRIWKINIDIDDNGHGTVTPILIDEGGLAT